MTQNDSICGTTNLRVGRSNRSERANFLDEKQNGNGFPDWEDLRVTP